MSESTGVFDLVNGKIVYDDSEVCVNYVDFPAFFA
jgi:hypothetical protein